MSDRRFFGLVGAFMLLALALSLVWPQGLGARSPRPFGHETQAKRDAAAAAKARANGTVVPGAATLRGPLL